MYPKQLPISWTQRPFLLFWFSTILIMCLPFVGIWFFLWLNRRVENGEVTYPKSHKILQMRSRILLYFLFQVPLCLYMWSYLMASYLSPWQDFLGSCWVHSKFPGPMGIYVAHKRHDSHTSTFDLKWSHLFDLFSIVHKYLCVLC